MSGKRKLTSQQEAALANVTSSHRAYKEGKHLIRVELDREFERRTASLEAERNRAVLVADKLGVPRRRIHQDGMGQVGPSVLYGILDQKKERVVAEANDMAAEYLPVRWIDRQQKVVRVKITGFPTTATGEDYPEVLSGTAQRTNDGWVVLTDDSDKQDGLGFKIDGYLRWELGNDALSAVPTENQDLRVYLDEWVEANS